MSKIKIGFIGAGKRFELLFLPVLRHFEDQFQFVGAVTKSGRINPDYNLDIPVFQNVKELCESESPDLITIVVNSDLNYELCKEVVRYQKLILVETPVSHDWRKIAKLIKYSKRFTSTIAVAEGWPFLPMELFKKEIINTPFSKRFSWWRMILEPTTIME